MKDIYLDASALVKLDRQEPGSEVVDATIERAVSCNPWQLVVPSFSITQTPSGTDHMKVDTFGNV